MSDPKKTQKNDQFPPGSSKGRAQPEALATLAAASTHGGKKPDDLGLEATAETAPVATNPEHKNDAATKVLREGILGKEQGADAAVGKLPDRTKINK